MAKFLIDDWKRLHTFFSFWVNVIGAALFAFVAVWPVNAYTLWMAVPIEVKAVLPAQTLPGIGACIFVLAIFARVIRQKQSANSNTVGN